MRTGWLGFGRQRENRTALAPDKAVAGPKAWLLSAAILASTAALLGTSEVPPGFQTTYKFERLAIDGGFAELTRDQPSATFFVTVTADDLGPDEVLTTQKAQVLVQGDVTASDLDDDAQPPVVSFKFSSPDRSQEDNQSTAAHYEQLQDLTFTGDCENPRNGCAARFRLDLSRQDGGESGGIVRFDWSFDATGSGQKTTDEKEDAELGPFDPPWSVEITQQ